MTLELNQAGTGMNRYWIATWLVAAGLVGVGCGGESQGSEEDARKVAEGFLAAAAAGDADKACAYVDSSDYKKQSTCVNALGVFLAGGSGKPPEIKSVTVLEGSATVRLEPRGYFILVDVDGEYKVDLESTLG